MGERKVINKYYPPDFDPSKLPRTKRPKNNQTKVRSMLPFKIRCNTCGHYMGEGTKFNSRIENVINETYLGLKIFRFYSNCKNCNAEFIFKTDPQNLDYVVQSGVTRISEPRQKKRNAEEMGDAMKYLESKTFDSKREMDILAALDEMKSMKSRRATVSVDSMLVALKRRAVEKEKEVEEEDEALVKSIKFHGSKDLVRRVNDEDFDDDGDFSNWKKKVVDETPRGRAYSLTKTSFLDSSSNIDYSVAAGNAKSIYKFSNVRLLVVTNETVISNSNNQAAKGEATKQVDEDKAIVSSTGLQSLCQSYASDDD